MSKNAITDERIQEIRELCGAATPGPWSKIIRKGKQIYCGNEFKPVAAVCELYDDESEANLRYIAISRQIVPELLEEIEQLNMLDKIRVAAFVKMTAERDHWKARAERLGRTMQSEDECRFCVKKDRIEACTARAYAPGCDWQFDEARFAAEINHD